MSQDNGLTRRSVVAPTAILHEISTNLRRRGFTRVGANKYSVNDFIVDAMLEKIQRDFAEKEVQQHDDIQQPQ